MIEVYKCECCSSIFESEEDCKQHEKNDHNETDRFKKVILDSVKKCNGMYNMKKQAYDIFIDVSCVVELDDEVTMTEYYVCFMLDNDEIKICDNEFDLSDNIRKSIEDTYFKYINKIDGKLTYKLGGYHVGDIRIKDILKGKEGYRLKLELISNEEKFKPLNKQWISVNFENQGKCPKCNERVVDGYFETDEKCPKCGILLDWK